MTLHILGTGSGRCARICKRCPLQELRYALEATSILNYCQTSLAALYCRTNLLPTVHCKAANSPAVVISDEYYIAYLWVSACTRLLAAP